MCHAETTWDSNSRKGKDN
ncbi:hypothetical protein AYX15_07114 [Cryptococcus neoformans]|nr:hypothetical protein AYX15_07114 [Cryptococcus neoformans var. grubii]